MIDRTERIWARAIEKLQVIAAAKVPRAVSTDAHPPTAMHSIMACG